MRFRVEVSLAFVLAVVAEGLAASPGGGDARVVAAWPANLFEARIAFDQPADPSVTGRVVGRTIHFDAARPSVGAKPAGGSPGGGEPRDTKGSLQITSARLDDAGRTLVLTTDPHPRVATYTFELPLTAGRPPIAIAYDLSGIEAAWDDGREENATPAWTGWWPEIDAAAVRSRLIGSVTHERGFAVLARRGRLTLSALIVAPKGASRLRIASSAPIEATLGGEGPDATAGKPDAGNPSAVFRIEPTGEPMLLSLVVPTEMTGRLPRLRVTVAAEPGEESALRADQFVLPWAPPAPPPPARLEIVPELAGGDARNGAIVFASNEAKCANCHKVRGQGGSVGPDLSDLVGRDRTEVYRDIAEPSARIHPDYVPFTVALKDGRVLVGTVRSDGADAVRVSDTEAKTTVLRRADVEEFRPSATSIMPVGLAGAIGEARLRDLVAFLTTPIPAVVPPSPPR